MEVPVRRVVEATMAVVVITAAASLPAVAQQPPMRSVRQLSMDAVPRLEPDGIRRVQHLLKEKGFDPVQLDGVVGPHTRASVSGFQEKYGINKHGEIDNQTLLALGAVDLAGPAAGELDRSR
jgi:peptidoglycan hydrolase-like protein with peptidoglycan-binding domain